MMIDVFNHFMPKAYFDRLGDLIPGHVALTAFPRPCVPKPQVVA